MRADGRTPVLVGVGVAGERSVDLHSQPEPLALMLAAARAAGHDTGHAPVLQKVDWVGVPKGRWSYRNPAGALADAIGATGARSVLTSVGVLQQSLVAEACARIARGESEMTLVCGGDAGFRLQSHQRAGEIALETATPGEPDEYWEPAEELRHPLERRAGLKMPVGLYALIDSAWRYRRQIPIEPHREDTAQLLARFSEIAAANPSAWRQKKAEAEFIREGAERNPMLAFPYTRAHCSSWSVDQASALLFCSVDRAREHGIHPGRWIYPWSSAESNHMLPVSARKELDRAIGAEIAAASLLAHAGVEPAAIELVDLYSCFPIAVRVHAEALGLSTERDLTLTGGMPFAGGPYNNYQLQAIARAATLLRAGSGKFALVSGVSGILTKHGFGIWSASPPSRTFERIDVTDKVARATTEVEVVEGYQGVATVRAFTVLHETGHDQRLLALLDTPEGKRVIISSTDRQWVVRAQQRDLIGHAVRVAGSELIE